LILVVSFQKYSMSNFVLESSNSMAIFFYIDLDGAMLYFFLLLHSLPFSPTRKQAWEQNSIRNLPNVSATSWVTPQFQLDKFFICVIVFVQYYIWSWWLSFDVFLKSWMSLFLCESWMYSFDIIFVELCLIA